MYMLKDNTTYVHWQAPCLYELATKVYQQDRCTYRSLSPAVHIHRWASLGSLYDAQ